MITLVAFVKKHYRIGIILCHLEKRSTLKLLVDEMRVHIRILRGKSTWQVCVCVLSAVLKRFQERFRGHVVHKIAPLPTQGAVLPFLVVPLCMITCVEPFW